jgi:hypothetical protein
MERVARIAMKVVALGRRDQEREQALVADQRTHRMESRPAIWAHRAQESQPYPVLIEQGPAGLAELWLRGTELLPGQHDRILHHS